MCETCGCGLPGEQSPAISVHHHDHEHDHADLSHGHDHHHHHERGTIKLQRSIIEKNNLLAERNRGFFHAHGVLVLNVVSAPGAGKTYFIRETIRQLDDRLKTSVIVGDLATDNDARRLRDTGALVIQINTGTVCHLDAEMVARTLKDIPFDGLDLLIIENVGNLVCPASFDLGEDLRVVLLSVADGEDKPLKYPPIFHSAGVVVVSKSDLAEACAFNRIEATANIRHIAHHAVVFETSAKTGNGMDAWCDFIVQEQKKAQARGPGVP